ncbi:F-box/FBD/LRR-repeat protein At1g13570-like [Bidens hawaiensis]|uniref:F-box/FBD/LRR-repeat protein At1g13570-like n=1 Tax=Bidens hawaiensis TaxID=980011 RepID=UPI00404A2317
MKNTKHLCEAERLPLDRISTLPQPIIETILCRLPTTEEAARTSILSRDWRYKWTTIPKLHLCHDVCFATRRNMDMGCEACYDLQQILLHHQGPIRNLALELPEDHCLELDQIILSLLTNHAIKKLTLVGTDGVDCWYKVPVSIFSLRRLTDLAIVYCELDHTPIHSVFCSLQKLNLWYVGISTKTLLHILSNSPSLKSFDLLIGDDELDNKCTIDELFERLPVIEHLTTWHNVSTWLVLDSVPQELPASLIHLKRFHFQEMFFGSGSGLTFLLVLIKCSPNLEEILLENDFDCFWDKEYSWKDYSDVRLERLNELEFYSFRNSKCEMEFVKLILARSPRLKKLSIHCSFDLNQQLEMFKTLLEAPRVSPVVITVR